jgi:macrolide-specific efflux system membrane fusion protein
MRFVVLMLSGLWLVSSSGANAAAETITVPNCLLSLDAEVQVPAQEAGVLMKIPVREGQLVSKGDLLAQVDDIVPRAAYNVALYKLKVAEKQAVDDIDVQYSIAAFHAASAKLERSLKANAKSQNTVSDSDVDEQKLEKEKFRLSILKAKKDQDVAGLQKQVSEAELDAARANVDRRQLVATLDAEVIELSRREGEWVQPGDTVMRLLRLDRLRVEGVLDAKNYRLSEIQGRPVDVVVTLARGQKESFPGKIVFVNPLVRTGGNFQVRAEVVNRKQDGFWVLSPGMPATMTIQLK